MTIDEFKLAFYQNRYHVGKTDPLECSRCSRECTYKEGFHICWTHRIARGQDTPTGAHFCLEHECYHCYRHWKACCKTFGHSVMTPRPVTSAHLKKRALEIIREQDREIRNLEAYMYQIRNARFICAECRQIACICDMTKWKRYNKKRRENIKNKNNNNVGPFFY